MITVTPSSPTVEVLLSTHNGEQYIAMQLASILSQSRVDLRVLIRDDGSTDRTAEEVLAIAGGDSRLRLEKGPQLGWGSSFMTLLASSGDAHWFAFSDQDDVWLPDKLARAVAHLEPLDDGPAVYGSAMLSVDDEFRPLFETVPPRRVSFENALVQNVLPGCTMVLNRAARALCLRRMPRHVVHDWWLYLVIAAFGTVIFDEAITVLHRVHRNNATALPLWRHWPRRVSTHFKLPAHRRPSAFVREFHEIYGDLLDGERRRTVENLLSLHEQSWLSRARYAFQGPLFRQSATDNAILRLLLTFGRF